MEYKSLPKHIKAYAFLGWEPETENGAEYVGPSIFHSKSRKFYVNAKTGQYHDKYSGHSGNWYTYLRSWHNHCKETYPLAKAERRAFAKERGIPVEYIRDAGLFRGMFLDGIRWGLPVRNKDGKVTSVLKWKGPGSRLYWPTGSNSSIIGLEDLPPEEDGPVDRIYWVEGPWDRMALKSLLDASEPDFTYVVLAVPGAETFKPEWAAIAKRGVINLVCFDNDEPGRKGSTRTVGVMKSAGVTKLRTIRWPMEAPTGYDLRDFVKDGGTLKILEKLTAVRKDRTTAKTKTVRRTSSNGRVSWEELIGSFGKWLNMSPEHEDALRIVLAVILSNRFGGGDPLWLHLVASPGSGKTELLMSVSMLDDVVTASSITAHSLVSGFQSADDPSLIPELLGNTFILKDFTEVLEMQKKERDEVYKILRGAFDGKTERKFGNGKRIVYKGYFSMITGVTHAIDGENNSALGERFLKYRLDAKRDATETILDALNNVGKEERMREALTTVTSDYLTFDFDPEKVPDIGQEENIRIASLANLVSMFRTQVPRDSYHRDRLAYKPQPEIATRAAKQLKRLRVGLGLLNDPFQLTEADFALVQKCALDSGTAYLTEVVTNLRAQPGQTVTELSKKAGAPLTTIKEQLEDMEINKIVTRKKGDPPIGGGRPPDVWSLSKETTKLMKGAGL